jgi:hypothetical protein
MTGERSERPSDPQRALDSERSSALSRRPATCYHDWEPCRALLFGLIKVTARCRKCKTFFNKGGDR